MTRAKASFQRNKDLFDKWGAIAGSNWFEDVLSAASAEMWELGGTDEQMKGARNFINILQGLADKDTFNEGIPKSKLLDDLQIDLVNRNKQ